MRLFGFALVACVVAAIWLITQLPHPAGTYEYPHTTAVPDRPTVTVTVPPIPAAQDRVPTGTVFDGYYWDGSRWLRCGSTCDDVKRGA